MDHLSLFGHLYKNNIMEPPLLEKQQNIGQYGLSVPLLSS